MFVFYGVKDSILFDEHNWSSSENIKICWRATQKKYEKYVENKNGEFKTIFIIKMRYYVSRTDLSSKPHHSKMGRIPWGLEPVFYVS